jgi:hypothetical protein
MTDHRHFRGVISELGDPEGRLVWKRIKRAIEHLNTTPTVMH